MPLPRARLEGRRSLLYAIDESRRGAMYLLAAVAMLAEDQRGNRRAATHCLLPGEQAWHMAKERPARRRQALSAMTLLPLSVTIYRTRITTRDRGEEQARRRCFRGLVEDLPEVGACHLLIESRDDHLDRHDRRTLQALLVDGDVEASYTHHRHAKEPLLWIADAYAWAAGGDSEWRRRLHPTTRVITL